MRGLNPNYVKLTVASIFGALIMSGVVNSSQAQKIDKKRPSVYITFQRFVEKTPDPAYPSEGAQFLLHNNTRWPIYVGKDYDPTIGGESVIYIIELPDGGRVTRKRVHGARDDKVMPGATLTFLVPRGDFPKGGKIYVEFFFSWEFVPPQDNIGDQTVHRAYFRASDLPAWLHQ